MEVDIAPGVGFAVGVPKPLFDMPVKSINGPGDVLSRIDRAWMWDVSPDDQRFLVNRTAERPAQAPLIVVTNWLARLKK